MAFGQGRSLDCVEGVSIGHAGPLLQSPPVTPNQQPQPAAATQPDQIAGLVERVTFHNDESGFCVLRIKARGHRDLVTVVGTLPEVRAGEWLEAQGSWTIDKEYGQQFRAEILRTMPPTTVEGIEKYLASGKARSDRPRHPLQCVQRHTTRPATRQYAR